MKNIFIQRIYSARNSLLFFWQKSPLNFLFGLLFVIVSIIGMYMAMLGVFNFIITLGGIGTIILKKIIFIMFLVLFFMVGVSFAALFYGVAIASRETEFLFSLPLEKEKIILYKFTEAAIFAAWIPLVGIFFFFLAYAHVGAKSLFLAVCSVPFTFPLMAISCFLGYTALLLVLRFFNLKKFVLIATILLLLGTCIIIMFCDTSSQDNDFILLLSDEIFFLQFSRLWFFPFSWPAHGLIHLEDARWGKSVLYFLNLWALGCLGISSIFSLCKMFMQAYHRRFSTGQRKTLSRDYIAEIIYRFPILPKSLRYFIIKDIKLFLRTPSIYLQFLVPFGILFFYFLNLRRLSYHLMGLTWINILTFLNVFGILCIVAGITVRFVFPQWSLEGRNFWILKLAPVSLRKIFFAKLFLSFGFLFIISETLIFTANHMLRVDGFLFQLTLWLIGIATFTIVSLSLGLGAFFADFKQAYYLKAVESFGGFITLVLTFGYIFLTASLFGLIVHLYSTARLTDFYNILRVVFIVWVIIGSAVGLFSIWQGLRRLEAKEY